ncbi:hypothetical protein FRC03_010322 [Tulasnella sp. 419]|nr:hypothetical protein FRC03_010322 [Tulasnella sp. 419]
MSSSSSVAYQEFELPIVGHYNYIPTEWVCGLFIALFTLTGLCHLYQSVWYNMYWLIFTLVLCAAGEIAGWSFRLWSNHHPEPFNPFFIQMLLLYIAPFFMAVSMYIILQRIISVVGVEHSKLKPRTYSIIFIVFDLLALCVQLVGGCGASINAGEVPEAAERDAWIIFGGVLVQIIVMTAYTILALKYCLLVRITRSKSLSPQLPMAAVETGLITKESQHPATDPLATRIQSMIVGLLISTVFIVVRSIYRTIVLIDGWNGRQYILRQFWQTPYLPKPF